MLQPCGMRHKRAVYDSNDGVSKALDEQGIEQVQIPKSEYQIFVNTISIYYHQLHSHESSYNLAFSPNSANTSPAPLSPLLTAPSIYPLHSHAVSVPTK